MKYKEYKELIIRKMPQNPIPGLWQHKEPQSHILGNPSTPKEKAELINKYSLLPGVPRIDYNRLHLHLYAHHLNSSQIMCYNFFRPLMKDTNSKMYKPSKPLIDLIEKEIGDKVDIEKSFCNFEYIKEAKEGRKERTNFDFYLCSGETEVFFEVKYTEEYFSPKCKAKNPQKQYETVYSPLIDKTKNIFIDGTISEKDFNNKYYQLARNAIRACSPKKHVFFVCPKAHKKLISQFDDFSNKHLTDYGKKLVKLITWEDLVDAAKSLSIDMRGFNKRYLSFLQ